MKKRSLVAAIAMLVVSAIVLTSSTYAWFSTNSGASVGALQATVTNNDGSLQVAAAGTYAKNTTYKVGITANDYENYLTNLVPCSMSLTSASASAPTFKVVSLGTSATAGAEHLDFSGIGDATENTHYLAYQFKVLYTNNGSTDMDITLTPTFSRAANYLYALVKVSDTNGSNPSYTIYSGDSYTPVTGFDSGVTAIPDANDNAILDSEEGWTSGTNPSSITGVQNAGNIVFAANAPGAGASSLQTEKLVTVYIWAEGNDSDCTGGADGLAVSLSFAIGAAAHTNSTPEEPQEP